MNKLAKLLTPILTVGAVATPFVALTSCSNTTETERSVTLSQSETSSHIFTLVEYQKAVKENVLLKFFNFLTKPFSLVNGKDIILEIVDNASNPIPLFGSDPSTSKITISISGSGDPITIVLTWDINHNYYKGSWTGTTVSVTAARTLKFDATTVSDFNAPWKPTLTFNQE